MSARMFQYALTAERTDGTLGTRVRPWIRQPIIFSLTSDFLEGYTGYFYTYIQSFLYNTASAL